MDELLRLLLLGGVKLITYADDVTVLVDADSHNKLKAAATITLGKIVEWGERNRLCFTPQKPMIVTMRR